MLWGTCGYIKAITRTKVTSIKSFITTDGQTPPYDDRIFILLLFTRVGSMPKHSLTIFSDNDPLMFGDFRYFIVRETMYNVI